MTRYASNRRVFFVEEPLYDDIAGNAQSRSRHDGVFVVVPHCRSGSRAEQIDLARSAPILDQLIARERITRYVLVVLHAAGAGFRAPHAVAVVYDCMDELSAFQGAPPELLERRSGSCCSAPTWCSPAASLYEAKRAPAPERPRVPEQRRRARTSPARAATQPRSAGPGAASRTRGSASSASSTSASTSSCSRGSPRAARLAVRDDRPGRRRSTRASCRARRTSTTSAPKRYDELPAYLAGWDVALLPFARNEATRFISPTKTPEYLAAGRPVVSTPIRDVVQPYGEQGLVRIADDRERFVPACERRCATAPSAGGPRRRVPAEHVVGPHLAPAIDVAARRRDSRPRAGSRRSCAGRPALRRRARSTMFDYLDRRRRLRGRGPRRAAGRRRAASACCSCDKRTHIGGNAYDYYDDAGILIHRYGPHIFHTNSRGRLRLPVAVHRVAAVPAPRAARRSTASSCRCRSTSTRSTGCTARTSRRWSSSDFFAERRRAARADPHLRGRRRQHASAASCTRSSSGTTRASSGASIRRSSTRR